MKKLETIVKAQKKEKGRLELQIDYAYGGSEWGVDKQEKMITVMNMNRNLQARLEALNKESGDIMTFAEKTVNVKSQTVNEMNEIKT
jgi:hypothetical protein